MTAKEKLRAAVEELSESEAADTLDYIASRRHSATDALGELLENAPWDDEPTTPEEQAGVRAGFLDRLSPPSGVSWLDPKPYDHGRWTPRSNDPPSGRLSTEATDRLSSTCCKAPATTMTPSSWQATA